MPDHYPDTETTSEDTSSGVHARANFDKSSGTGKLANITRRVTIRLGKVEKRSTINAEKITKLKNITQLRKKNVDKKISGSSVLLDSLNGINDSLNGMLGILGDRERFDAQIAENERKAAESAKRGASEKKLESKAFDGLKQTARKVLAPAMSLWERLWDFLSTVLLGRVAIKLWEWFSNKENQKKVAAIGRFLKDWWPVLLSSYILFGTGFTKMVAGLLKVVGWGITKIVALIPKILAAIGKLKVGKLLKLIPGGGKLGGMKGLTGMFQMGASAFAEGGVVPGSGDGDTVPAMLTPGEFVMSKGAVQKYGVDTLAGMNAAGGGTNVPKGLPGLGGGGGGTNSLTEQAKVKTWGNAILDFLSGDDGKSRRMTEHDKWMEMAGGGLVPYFSGGEKKEGFDKVKGGISRNAKALLNTIRWAEGTLKPGGYNTWFGGRTDMDLTKMTIDEVVAEQKRRLSAGEATYGKYTSAAVGAYQMMLPEQFAPRAGLNGSSLFTPENQDKMAIAAYMKGRLSNKEIDSPISRETIAKISGVWSSLPTMSGASAHGQPVKKYSDLENVYNKNLKSLDPNSYSAATTSIALGKGSTSVPGGGGSRGKNQRAWWDVLGWAGTGKRKKKGENQFSETGINIGLWGEMEKKSQINAKSYNINELLKAQQSNKTNIKQPQKRTTTIAYDQEMAAQQNASMPGSAMNLPSINPSAMISPPKIAVLGISV